MFNLKFFELHYAALSCTRTVPTKTYRRRWGLVLLYSKILREYEQCRVLAGEVRVDKSTTKRKP